MPSMLKVLQGTFCSAIFAALISAPAVAQVVPLTENTDCDQPKWNAKYGIYLELYRPSLRIERDALYDHINGFSKRARLVENGLQVYGALNTISGNLQMETATDVAAGALATTGEAVGVFGNSTASIAAEQLLEWGELAIKRDPKTFADYFVTNTLKTAAGLYGTVGMNALIDKYRLVSSADEVLFEYYRHCGNQDEIEEDLDLSRDFENAEASLDFLSWATIQNASKSSYSASKESYLAEMISRIVTGVNTTYDQLRGSAVASGTPDLEPYAPDLQPRTVGPGGSVMVEFGAENEGDGIAKASRARLRLTTSPEQVTGSDPVLATVDMSSLPAGASSSFEKNVTLPTDLSAGTYYVWLILDVNSEAGQKPADEGNDKAYEELTIEHLTPDLEPSQMYVTPSSSHPGEVVKVEFNIANWGEGAADPSRARLRVGTSNDVVTTENPELTTIDIPALAPEEEIHVEKNVRLPSSLNVDTRYYMWLIVDVTSEAGQTFADEKDDRSYEGIQVE